MNYIEKAIDEFDKEFTEELDRNFIGEYFQGQIKKFIEEKIQKAYNIGKEEQKEWMREERLQAILAAEEIVEKKAIQDYKKELLEWCEERIYPQGSQNGDIEDNIKEELKEHLTK